ncbi:MAG TPA: hypothetical protein VFQ70_01700, partial [Candidatus Saccharimonadaceae bacterium]|nr:hypothetical protein [Candidatus Saccharimonadaceae bacterium]
VRKSAMRHGIFTDALTRFNKGQSPHQNDHIMNLLIQSIKDVSDAEQASDVIDLKATKENTPSVTVAPECINDRLGLKLSSDEMEALLRNVEIRVEDGLIVAPPFWRTDIEIPEDVVEEVGRLYGFDKLPRELPRRSIKPAPENKLVTTKQLIRESLAAMGANEVLSYSFVDGSLLSRAGQDIEHAYRLSNALSPDLQYYRLSLIPSLIGKVHTNVKAGYDNFALFEIGKVHDTAALDDSGLPLEFEQTAFVYTAQKPQFQGATYYQAKYYLDNLLAMCQVTRHVRYSALDSADLEKHEWLKQLIAPFEGERLAVLHDSQDGSPIGVIGEFRPEVTKQFKLPEHTAGFEVDTLLFSRGDTSDLYTPLSKYPSVSQDISLKVPRGVSYHDVHEATQLAVEKTRSRDVRVIVKPLDIYAADSDASDKTFTFRLTLTALDRTLRDSDAKPILEAIRRAVEGTFAA